MLGAVTSKVGEEMHCLGRGCAVSWPPDLPGFCFLACKMKCLSEVASGVSPLLGIHASDCNHCLQNVPAAIAVPWATRPEVAGVRTTAGQPACCALQTHFSFTPHLRFPGDRDTFVGAKQAVCLARRARPVVLERTDVAINTPRPSAPTWRWLPQSLARQPHPLCEAHRHGE